MSQAKYSEHVLRRPGAPTRSASFGRRLRGAGTLARRAWREAYVRRLVVGDAGCALLAAMAGYLAGFGAAHAWTAPESLALVVALPAVWVTAMHAQRSHGRRPGAGPRRRWRRRRTPEPRP